MVSLKGRVSLAEKGYWVIELPAVAAITQGTSREDAFLMLEDYLECHLEEKPAYNISDDGGKDFTINFSVDSNLLPWVLKQLRQSNGLSHNQAAEKLGLKSNNAYRRYEEGRSTPTVSKLHDLLSITGHKLVIE